MRSKICTFYIQELLKLSEQGVQRLRSLGLTWLLLFKCAHLNNCTDVWEEFTFANPEHIHCKMS